MSLEAYIKKNPMAIICKEDVIKISFELTIEGEITEQELQYLIASKANGTNGLSNILSDHSISITIYNGTSRNLKVENRLCSIH